MQVRGFGVEPPSIAEYRFDVVGGLAKAHGSVWGPRMAGLSRHVGLPQMAGRHVREVSSRLAGPDGAFCLDGQLSGAIQTWSWDPVALAGEVSRVPNGQGAGCEAPADSFTLTKIG